MAFTRKRKNTAGSKKRQRKSLKTLGQIAVLASDSVIAKEARAQADELMEKAGEVAREINLGQGNMLMKL